MMNNYIINDIFENLLFGRIPNKKRNDYHSMKKYCTIVLSIRRVCKLTLLNIQSHQ